MVYSKPFPIWDQKGQNWYTISDQTTKNIPFEAEDTYITHIRNSPLGVGGGGGSYQLERIQMPCDIMIWNNDENK